MRSDTKAAARSLISDYSLHDTFDGDEVRVDLAPLESAFTLRRDDLSEFDMAGMVLLPEGGDVREDNPATIVVHSDLDAQRSRLIYAHEIGHAIVGHEGSLRLSEMDSWFSNKAEREAWQVASMLLIPWAVVWAAAARGWTEDQIAAICNVPEWLVELYPR